MAMGSPLGPTFANIFMSHLEEEFFNQCPSHFKPIFYRRYVDHTFLLFTDESHAQLFLEFVNAFHPNIKFTTEKEQNGQISFLDILVSRSENRFVTSIFRKETFTGLGLNFFSHCSMLFKINSCKTLIHRAFSLCSNWMSFHEEIRFLKTYFMNNCYPAHVFTKATREFLDNIFRPQCVTATVPKKIMYVSLPYINNSKLFKHELLSILNTLYPYVDFRLIFKNPFTIGKLFHFKDTLPELMRSCLVYEFNCPKCNFGTYVGCSKRMLKVRIDSRRCVSHRTGLPLNRKEHSAIRIHSNSCHHQIQYKDFKILAQTQNAQSLPFLESLHIKQLSPSLNNQTTSIPLSIA